LDAVYAILYLGVLQVEVRDNDNVSGIVGAIWTERGALLGWWITQTEESE